MTVHVHAKTIRIFDTKTGDELPLLDVTDCGCPQHTPSRERSPSCDKDAACEHYAGHCGDCGPLPLPPLGASVDWTTAQVKR